jgi:hypothetical protein
MTQPNLTGNSCCVAITNAGRAGPLMFSIDDLYETATQAANWFFWMHA